MNPYLLVLAILIVALFVAAAIGDDGDF